MQGIKSLPDGDFCAYCNTKVNLNLYSFCPKCGNALNEAAIKLAEQRETKIKIELLDELASEIEDENSLKVIVKKLKNM